MMNNSPAHASLEVGDAMRASSCLRRACLPTHPTRSQPPLIDSAIMASRRRPHQRGSSSSGQGDEDPDSSIAAPGQDFLDESEQAQVVEELRRQHREHARNYRVCMRTCGSTRRR